MRMLIVLLVVLLSAGAAQAECRPDVAGTFKTTQPELATVNHLTCLHCREINHHPQDMRNVMWNWAALGRGGDIANTGGVAGLGRYIFVTRMNARLIVEPVWGDSPGSNVMSVPITNQHGQTATATMDITHNLIGVYTTYGFRIGINTGIRSIRVHVTLPNGNQVAAANYSVTQYNADRNRAGYRRPVPADTARDFARDGDCLNNLGEQRVPLPQQPDPVGGGGSAGGEDPYERWWDEEAAYGGRTPDCGWSSPPSTGDNVWVCYW